MKNELLKIAKDLEQGTVTPEQAQTLLLGDGRQWSAKPLTLVRIQLVPQHCSVA